jgi:quinol monooxygenase YgiN
LSQDIFAIAVVRPEEGYEEEVLRILRDLYAVMTQKNYSRNVLYRDAKDPRRLVNLRYWTSEDARTRAQEDPDVHRHWARLGQVAKVEQVMEQLDEISMESGSSIG